MNGSSLSYMSFSSWAWIEKRDFYCKAFIYFI